MGEIFGYRQMMTYSVSEMFGEISILHVEGCNYRLEKFGRRFGRRNLVDEIIEYFPHRILPLFTVLLICQKIAVKNVVIVKKVLSFKIDAQ